MTRERAPTAALLLIGNELLSGRTQDINLQHLAIRLGERGIRLIETRIIADDADAIVAAVNALRAGHDLVFTTGGIGPTHDDITADCIARAFDVPIGIDAQARTRLERYAADRGYPLNEDSLRMARIPTGAMLIDNPVSAAPGFRIGNVLVMAGVPIIMQGMLDGVLDSLPRGDIVHSVSSAAFDVGESAVATGLRALQAAHPAIDIGSYPGRLDGRSRLELVARGTDVDELEQVRLGLEHLLESRRRC